MGGEESDRSSGSCADLSMGASRDIHKAVALIMDNETKPDVDLETAGSDTTPCLQSRKKMNRSPCP